MSELSNSNHVNKTNVMDEEQRFAYLNAMGVNCWLPKNNIQETEKEPSVIEKEPSAKENEFSAIEPPQTLDNEPSAIENTEEKAEQGKEYSQAVNTEISKPEIKSVKVVDEIKQLKPNLESDQTESNTGSATPSNANLIQTDEFRFKSNEKSDKYLKLVNWTNINIKQENSRKLLIICRHQIDQPAHSFARANSPSQFMLDYINALLSLTQNHSFELDVQMAHLSEAGLGKDSLPMAHVLNECKPDCVLLLGDDTVTHLLSKETDVANLRGRLVEFEQKHKAIVSYHPFSLIENPGLKSLALEDLSILANYFFEVHSH